MGSIKEAIRRVTDWSPSNPASLIRLSACLFLALYFPTRVGNLVRDMATERHEVAVPNGGSN